VAKRRVRRPRVQRRRGGRRPPGRPETHGRRRRSKHCAAAIRAGQVSTCSPKGNPAGLVPTQELPTKLLARPRPRRDGAALLAPEACPKSASDGRACNGDGRPKTPGRPETHLRPVGAMLGLLRRGGSVLYRPAAPAVRSSGPRFASWLRSDTRRLDRKQVSDSLTRCPSAE
jgi:hypothetical protein